VAVGCQGGLLGFGCCPPGSTTCSGYTGAAIAPLLAVEFDAVPNAELGDPTCPAIPDHVGIVLNGNPISSEAASVCTSVTGSAMHGKIDYTPGPNGAGTLNVFLAAVGASFSGTPTLTYSINLGTSLAGSYGYAGFTAGTGTYGSYDNIQNWTLQSAPISSIDGG